MRLKVEIYVMIENLKVTEKSTLLVNNFMTVRDLKLNEK